MIDIKYIKYLLTFLVLLFIMLGVLGYFSSLYEIKDKDLNPNPEDERTEANPELASSLYESIRVYEDGNKSNNDIDYYTSNVITNNTKLRVGIKNLDLNFNGKYSLTIKASVVEEQIKNIFGPTVTFVHQNVTYDCVNFIYDEKKDTYSAEDSKCNKKSSSFYYSVFDKAYIENGDLIIEEKVLYEEGILDSRDTLTNVYVYTLNKESQLGLEAAGSYQLDIDKYKDTASVVTYLFVRGSDGTYYFANAIK